MTPTALPALQVTPHDFDRLTRLVESCPPVWTDIANRLAAELERAVIVPPERLPADVVTMNSRVSFWDDTAQAVREVTLVYPHAADVTLGRVSVLTPVGSALLGLAVGQTIDWLMPDRRVRTLRVEGVWYQPEAAGHHEL